MKHEPTEYESVATAFVAAIRAVAAITPGAVVLTLNKGEAEGVATSFERLMRERDELREASRALLADRSVTLCSRCEGRGEVEFEVLPDGRRPASRHCTLCDGTGERVLVRRLRALLEAKP